MMDVLSHAEAVREDREVTIFVSYMEVYNEQVNDLLDASNANLRIREDPSEGYYVSGLKTMRIGQIEDVTKIIALGERNRHYR